MDAFSFYPATIDWSNEYLAYPTYFEFEEEYEILPDVERYSLKIKLDET